MNDEQIKPGFAVRREGSRLIPPADIADSEHAPRMFESWGGMEGIPAMPPHDRTRFLPDRRWLFTVYPGVLVTFALALAAAWLSQHYQAPVMLFALFLGMAFHFLHQDGRCVAGIEFSSKVILRVGVALLGARIT